MNTEYILILAVLVVVVTIMIWNNKESYVGGTTGNYVSTPFAKRYQLEDDAYQTTPDAGLIPNYKFVIHKKAK